MRLGILLKLVIMKQFLSTHKRILICVYTFIGIVSIVACDQDSKNRSAIEIQPSEDDPDSLRIALDPVLEKEVIDTTRVVAEPLHDELSEYKEIDIHPPLEMQDVQPVQNIDDFDFPEFNMPPPETDKRKKYILNKVFPDVKNLGDVNKAFSKILRSAGFMDQNGMPCYSYYQVKEDGKFKGFAIITKFEKIARSGDQLLERFNLDLDNTGKRSFVDYVFPARLKKGYYRFFAFLIADEYFGEREANTRGMEEMKNEMQMGAEELPEIIQIQSVTDKTSLHVFVYEYDQKENEKDGAPTSLKRIKTVDDHLSKAGIFLTDNALLK